MLAVRDLGALGAPPELVALWSEQVRELTDVQERAVRAGALDGHTNLLVVAPTSSGKTFVGEMAASSSAYARRQHAIFLVPFRALADEHYDLFRERYGTLLSVVISTSDWVEFDSDIRAGNFNLAVMTYEKLKSFVTQQPALLDRCTTLVVDEVQSISEGNRGANLELLLTQILNSEMAPQVICLSASLDDVNQLDTWLNATLVTSSERPVPLTQSVCELSGNAISVVGTETQSTTTLVNPQADVEELAVALAEKYVRENRQVVIFRSTVSKVIDTARKLRGRLPAVGPSLRVEEEINLLDDSDFVNDLRLCLAAGVGFHQADLTHQERSLVEGAFRAGDARVLVATSTLAMGVNLPTDVVIVADSTRPMLTERGWTFANLSVSEYRNAAGRAGRLGQRTAGFSVLLAEDSIQLRPLVNAYLLSKVEPIESQLPKKPFEDVVFDVVCSGIAASEQDLVEFVTSTFAFLTFYERAGGISQLRDTIRDSLNRCVGSGLVVQEGSFLYATALGKVLGGAGLSFRSVEQLATVVERSKSTDLSRTELVFEVATCSEVGDRPWLRRKYGVESDPRPSHAPSSVGLAPNSRLALILRKPTVSSSEGRAIARTKCLLDWMAGKGVRAISADFQGMGASGARIRDLGKNAAWLFDSLADAADVSGAGGLFTTVARELALEARYGLPAFLAPLARLRVPGIAREHLLRLTRNINDNADLYEPDMVLDSPDDLFSGLLTPTQLSRLRRAILADLKESISRKHAGQVMRAENSALPRRLIDDLYTAQGGALEQAITDAMNHVGLSASRVVRQPHGEEDIRLAHTSGTVIISVTASQDDLRPIRWNKAKEILGAGAGLNPINYVCIGRPGFEALAERSAMNIAREAGARSLLLIPMPVLAEAFVRIAEGEVQKESLGDVLATGRGILSVDGLPVDDRSQA